MPWGVRNISKTESHKRAGKTNQQVTAMVAWLANNKTGKLIHVANTEVDADNIKLRLQTAGADLSRVEIKLAGAK
jgi:hypothetical protein